MWISMLTINPENGDANADLKDANQLHKTVMSGMPETCDTPVLYRTDRSRNGRFQVTVVSHVQPNWEKIQSGTTPYLLEPPSVKAYDPEMSNGDLLRFRLKAHPTVSKKIGELGHRDRGRPLFIRTPEDRREWLRRRSEKLGFSLLDCDEIETGTIRCQRPEGRIEIPYVTFQGIIRVDDVRTFIDALGRNVGQKRAFGCGMLSVMRI